MENGAKFLTAEEGSCKRKGWKAREALDAKELEDTGIQLLGEAH